MKVHSPLLLTGILAALFTGCAGYNNTLFMTKSNIGLDFDAKPPTVEISVSRKEAVIAPSFEGGRTPPVMASFKPGAGTGGSFTSFFMGVDQTFAGGDAALAMAKLYDQPTTHNLNDYNSALTLSQTPTYTDVFRRIPGSGKTRPLIFGTDTSLGLKVAWSGAGGQMPDTVKLGFNRKEFAWAPLSATPTDIPAKVDQDGNPISKGVAIKMPAFLATIESKQTIGGDATDTNKIGVSALQYFATGDSATYLAMQQDVRAAMHARLDPNQQAFESRFSPEALNVFSDILFSAKAMLKHWAQQGDTRAGELLAPLNSLTGLDLPATYGDDTIPMYQFDPGSTPPTLKRNPDAQTAVQKNIDGVMGYLSSLEVAAVNLTNALAFVEQNKPLQLSAGAAAPQTLTPADAARLVKDLADLQHRDETLKAQLIKNSDINEAIKYVQLHTAPQKVTTKK